MKRPVLIAVIGYIIGIIVGLYLKTSIVFFYIFLAVIILLYKLLFNKKVIRKKRSLKLFSFKRYLRYIKIFINRKSIILFVVFSMIGSVIIVKIDRKYNEIIEDLTRKDEIRLYATVISNKQETSFNNKYLVKVKYKNDKVNFFLLTDKKTDFKFGEKIYFSGTFLKATFQKNYKSFNYSEYLRQQKIYGTIKVNQYEIITKKESFSFSKVVNQIILRIELNSSKVMNEKIKSMFLGILFGNKKEIDEDIIEKFRNSGLTHILAVSGMHVAYIISGFRITFQKLIGKRTTNILLMMVLILYMILVNFTPSVTRAGVMGIIFLLSKIIYRKNDLLTSISISLLLSLLFNPFLIFNTGLILTYSGVLGIVYFKKIILYFLDKIEIKNHIYKYKIRPKIVFIIDKIKEIISVSLSVQIMIFPVIIYNYNTVNIFFLISNLLIFFIIGPIVFLGFVLLIFLLINLKLSSFISIFFEYGIQFLDFISNIGKLPFSKLYVPTPNLFSIFFYYLIILSIAIIFKIIFNKKNNYQTYKRYKNLVAYSILKYRRKKYIIFICFVIFLIILILLNVYPKKLKIHFLDVGQGDSCFIITPNKKTILIDTGGLKNQDIGKNTIVPYVLDRGFNKIDYVFISHFDTDHVDGLFSILEEIKVNTIIISKQKEDSENYKKFRYIVKNNRIKVLVVGQGDVLKIGNDMIFKILWPNKEKTIDDNILNNDSLVCKLCYKNFSMLFTGDIEEIAEKEIIKQYENYIDILKSDVLKVAHHGSKSSSSEDFLKIVEPKIALIGVGENNKFGHPSEVVLNRLKDLNVKIYRTDKMGEISLIINSKGKIDISQFIK